MGWDYRPRDGGPRGAYVLRRNGTELATIEFLDDVTLPNLRLEQIVRAFSAIDDELNAPADAPYRSLGWASKAEHDEAWFELRVRAHGQEEAVRAYLNDMWKADGLLGAAAPLPRPVYERWCDIVAAAVEPQREEMAS